MKIGVPPLERAFQLAKSGLSSNVEEIRDTLKREGYSSEQIEGPALRKQLREIIKTVRDSKPPTP